MGLQPSTFAYEDQSKINFVTLDPHKTLATSEPLNDIGVKDDEWNHECMSRIKAEKAYSEFGSD